MGCMTHGDGRPSMDSNNLYRELTPYLTDAQKQGRLTRMPPKDFAPGICRIAREYGIPPETVARMWHGGDLADCWLRKAIGH